MSPGPFGRGILLGLVVAGIGVVAFYEWRFQVVSVGAPSVAEPTPRAEARITPGVETSREPSPITAPGAPASEAGRSWEGEPTRVERGADPTAGLRGFADDEMVRGWRELRVDRPSADELERGWHEYARLIREQPRLIGRALAETRTADEVAVDGLEPATALAFLAAVHEQRLGPFPELVSGSSGLDAFFERETQEETVDGSAFVAAGGELQDGMRVTFGVGVHRLPRLFQHRRPAPRDVTIAGAGMDATLLVLDQGITPSAAISNLRIEDCTVHTNGNYLFDTNEGAVVALDRVRVVGFDMGAGSSVAFGVRSAVVRARGCEFLGGYGRSPQSGKLLRSSSHAFFLQCADSTFERIRLGVDRAGAGATIRFSGCSFRDVFEDPREAARRKRGVLLDQCVIGDVIDRGELPARRLDDLFPGWESQLPGR